MSCDEWSDAIDHDAWAFDTDEPTPAELGADRREPHIRDPQCSEALRRRIRETIAASRLVRQEGATE